MENLLTLLSSQNVSLQLYIVQVILILSWCRLSGKKSLKKVGLNGVGGVMVSLILYHELVIRSLFLLVLIVWGFFPLVFGLKFTIVQTTLIEIWRKSFVAGVCCGVLGCGFVYLWDLHGTSQKHKDLKMYMQTHWKRLYFYFHVLIFVGKSIRFSCIIFKLRHFSVILYKCGTFTQVLSKCFLFISRVERQCISEPCWQNASTLSEAGTAWKDLCWHTSLLSYRQVVSLQHMC